MNFTDSVCRDRKSTRLNSSHPTISYAVFCLKKKKINSTEKADETGVCRVERNSSSLTQRTEVFTPVIGLTTTTLFMSLTVSFVFFFMDRAPTEFYIFSHHDALPI